MHKYTHVEALYQVARYVKATNANPECPEQYKVRTPVTFRGTVKLHGTNSGVTFGDQLVPQSRNRELTVENDNMGFAQFVAERKEALRDLEQMLRRVHRIDSDKELVLYGEWVGPGIQNGMATNKLPEKQWVLFGAATVAEDESLEYVDILGPLQDQYLKSQIHSVYDVKTWEITVDFSSDESKEAAVAYFERVTQEVEDKCPWGERFGIEGMGEGIVWVPTGEHWGNSDLYWKSKGDKHKEVKRAKRNRPSLDPEVLKSVEQFVEFSVTEARLNKGLDYLAEMGKPLEQKSTGDFLKWVGQDVKRECSTELETNDLKWKQVSKAVGDKAKGFFFAKTKAM